MTSRVKKNTIEVIAEIGVNHNGNLDLAKKMILKSKECGADYVKFQLYNVDKLALKNAGLAEYQKKNNVDNLKQYDLLKKLQLSKNYFKILMNYSKKNNIKFMSSVFDIESLNFLKKIKCNYLKIPSGEMSNYELLDELDNSFSNIIISTGMSNLSDIKKAYNFLINKKKILKEKITLLHCVSEYPTKSSNINLASIVYLKNIFDCSIGFSDHTKGVSASIASSLFNIRFIEKHFTLDKNLQGPDHSSSLEPREFTKMISGIKSNLKLYGNYSKTILPLETKNSLLVKKSIVAKTNIVRGQKFSKINITTKRPYNGISASKWFNVVGKIAKKNFKKNDFIEI